MLDHPLHSPHQTAILAALQYQGNRNDCGPFTVGTVINALLGKNLNAIELAHEMDRPIWRGPRFITRRIPNWVTFPWGIVDIFRSFGLNASWRFFASIDHLLLDIPQDVVMMPIIGQWKPLWAHVMTLVAWDPIQGWGFANTQYDHHFITWYSDETFRSQWEAFFRILVDVKPTRKETHDEF
jgi:hypothetical protein